MQIKKTTKEIHYGLTRKKPHHMFGLQQREQSNTSREGGYLGKRIDNRQCERILSLSLSFQEAPFAELRV